MLKANQVVKYFGSPLGGGNVHADVILVSKCDAENQVENDGLEVWNVKYVSGSFQEDETFKAVLRIKDAPIKKFFTAGDAMEEMADILLRFTTQ